MKIQNFERKRTEMISSLKLIYILFAEEIFLFSKNFKTWRGPFEKCSQNK